MSTLYSACSSEHTLTYSVQNQSQYEESVLISKLCRECARWGMYCAECACKQACSRERVPSTLLNSQNSQNKHHGKVSKTLMLESCINILRAFPVSRIFCIFFIQASDFVGDSPWQVPAIPVPWPYTAGLAVSCISYSLP